MQMGIHCTAQQMTRHLIIWSLRQHFPFTLLRNAVVESPCVQKKGRNRKKSGFEIWYPWKEVSWGSNKVSQLFCLPHKDFSFDTEARKHDKVVCSKKVGLLAPNTKGNMCIMSEWPHLATCTEHTTQKRLGNRTPLLGKSLLMKVGIKSGITSDTKEEKGWNSPLVGSPLRKPLWHTRFPHVWHWDIHEQWRTLQRGFHVTGCYPLVFWLLLFWSTALSLVHFWIGLASFLLNCVDSRFRSCFWFFKGDLCFWSLQDEKHSYSPR